jgi:geranylgeranyl diphosphate synthase type II
MDDDDFRRGVPTSHKVFGEGIAVLAGDALLTFAFELLTFAQGWPRYSVREILQELAVAAGSRYLVAGQVVDLESEGKKISQSLLNFIHESKTAALLRSSIRLGAMSANATPVQLRNLSDFGRSLGLAFQVIDDILDVTQTTEKLGKSAGKDITAEKATFPAVVGLERSRRIAQKLTKEARESLRPFGKKAEVLLGMADYLLERDY